MPDYYEWFHQAWLRRELTYLGSACLLRLVQGVKMISLYKQDLFFILLHP